MQVILRRSGQLRQSHEEIRPPEQAMLGPESAPDVILLFFPVISRQAWDARWSQATTSLWSSGFLYPLRYLTRKRRNSSKSFARKESSTRASTPSTAAERKFFGRRGRWPTCLGRARTASVL